MRKGLKINAIRRVYAASRMAPSVKLILCFDCHIYQGKLKVTVKSIQLTFIL